MLAQTLGYSPTSQPSLEQILIGASKPPILGPHNAHGPSSTNGLPHAPRAFTGPKPEKTVPETPATTSDKAKATSSDVTDTPGMQAMRAHTAEALAAWKLKFLQTWKDAPYYPPRGHIIVSGFVELDTPKAWLVVDVKAAWDPKLRSYDPKTVMMSIRRVQMKKQGPLGGP
jgi:hypothetical protein